MPVFSTFNFFIDYSQCTPGTFTFSKTTVQKLCICTSCVCHIPWPKKEAGSSTGLSILPFVLKIVLLSFCLEWKCVHFAYIWSWWPTFSILFLFFLLFFFLFPFFFLFIFKHLLSVFLLSVYFLLCISAWLAIDVMLIARDEQRSNTDPVLELSASFFYSFLKIVHILTIKNTKSTNQTQAVLAYNCY